jgi:hypothetical protein
MSAAACSPGRAIAIYGTGRCPCDIHCQDRVHAAGEASLARTASRPVVVQGCCGALANKMAQIVWALLARGGTYRAPPHKQAGDMTCTRPQGESQKNPLSRGRRPHMTLISLQRHTMSQLGQAAKVVSAELDEINGRFKNSNISMGDKNYWLVPVTDRRASFRRPASSQKPHIFSRYSFVEKNPLRQL